MRSDEIGAEDDLEMSAVYQNTEFCFECHTAKQVNVFSSSFVI